MKPRIKGVYMQRKRLASGHVAIYYRHRASGARLPDDPTSLAFHQRLAELNGGGAASRPAADGANGDMPKTVSGLFKRFKDSGVMSSLGAGTQTNYRRHLALVEPFLGNCRLKDVKRAHVSRILDQFKAQPYLADGIRRTLQRVWTYAAVELELDVNALSGLAKRTPTKSDDDGQMPAEEQEIHAYREANPRGTRRRLAFEILLATAFRISDAGRVTAGAIRSGGLALAVKKTGEPVVAAVTEELRLAFEAYAAACAVQGEPVKRYALGETRGKPLHKRTIAKVLGEGFAAAAWPNGKTAHALRYTAAIC